MSKYLMKSAAAIVLGLAATACSHDFDVMEKVEQQSIDNAQQTLGFYIPEDQDWKMTSNVTANFSVAGASDETYTVKIYSNNLFEDGIGYIITKKNVQGGQNFTAEFAYPAFQKSLYVGLTDSKGRTTYKIADIVDGKLTSLNDVSAARTRATGEFANHVGAYPDANMWTSKGFLAPPPLTTSQKLRAQYYFQMNHITNPNRPNYGQIDFFMQQVYDGGDDPMTNKSLEKYPSADYTPENNNYITSGEHMDHLTCGPDHTHTYNFNNGNCSTNPNVANRDQTDVNNTSQQHSDKIQLMLNTKTSCFGYANSDASYVRDDRWTLVGAATIDAFCDSDAGFQAWLANRLPANEEDIKCDDEYHRSYIGFDFDMLPDEKIFAGGTETWEEASESNGWKRTLISRTYAEYDYYRYDLYGAKYHYLSANGNQYCGQSRTIDPEPDEAAALTLLTNGWLPATGSANKRWIKVGGCNDGYYSDWIVTFMPADPGTTIIIEEENQTYTYAFEDNKTTCDFDLNDVVIWVKENENNSSKIDVTLVAAGCEFDNYVFLGTTRIEWLKGAEVHDALGIAKGVMFNTKSNTVDPSTFVTTTIDKPQGFNIEQADFRIMPYAKGSDFSDLTARKEKDGDGYIRTSALVTMESETATAPIGLVFPCKWHWPKERVIVSNAYDNFNKWGSLPNATVRATVSDWYKSPKSGQVVTWETTNE
ncbi:MAG: hypothetical protein VZQ78_00240 [Prevotella sp.]|nr:hypothetical protein [Prevotella sp.]